MQSITLLHVFRLRNRAGKFVLEFLNVNDNLVVRHLFRKLNRAVLGSVMAALTAPKEGDGGQQTVYVPPSFRLRWTSAAWNWIFGKKPFDRDYWSVGLSRVERQLPDRALAIKVYYRFEADADCFEFATFSAYESSGVGSTSQCLVGVHSGPPLQRVLPLRETQARQ